MYEAEAENYFFSLIAKDRNRQKKTKSEDEKRALAVKPRNETLFEFSAAIFTPLSP